MTITIGGHEFDHVAYDKEADVLYLRAGPSKPAADTFGTPEGHAVRLDDQGHVIGITVVNVKWLVEQNGKLVITVPELIETSASELAAALASS